MSFGTAPAPALISYDTYDGWWCWRCDGLGGPADGADAQCICCRGWGEHDQVLPPRCAPPAAMEGIDRRWWGIDDVTAVGPVLG